MALEELMEELEWQGESRFSALSENVSGPEWWTIPMNFSLVIFSPNRRAYHQKFHHAI